MSYLQNQYRTVHAMLRDESGATAIEYCIIAMLISLGIIAGATQIGTEVARMFYDAAAGF